MSKKLDHITICVCTYKRPLLLAPLILCLNRQKRSDNFYFSILIIDNDEDFSAKSVFDTTREKLDVEIEYYSVPDKNFASVRNAAILKSKGNYIAFIDDDEMPVTDWLLRLYDSLLVYNTDGVLGPVIPEFSQSPPKWLLKSKLAERNRFNTGSILTSKNVRTGNVLFLRDIFSNTNTFFDKEFGSIGGEDVDLFRRLISKGKKFIWCDEAVVSENVPENRTEFSYYLKRAFLRGYISFQYHKREMNLLLRVRIIAKSTLALLIYFLFLPFLLLFNFGYFLRYVIKMTDHLGRCLTAMGFRKNISRNL